MTEILSKVLIIFLCDVKLYCRCWQLSMCVSNVLVGGRNLNKFKSELSRGQRSAGVNDKCYNNIES